MCDYECDCGGQIDEGGWCGDCETYYDDADQGRHSFVVVDGSEGE